MISPAEALWLEESELPRNFVLNEQHHVILASSPRPSDPLNAYFMQHAHANKLPWEVEQLVRTLEQECERERCESKSAVLPGCHSAPVRVNVRTLHEAWGNHTSVTIEPVR